MATRKRNAPDVHFDLNVRGLDFVELYCPNIVHAAETMAQWVRR